jgi:hypothetical protein
VQQQRQNDNVGAYGMDGADKPAEGDLVHDFLHAGKGIGGIGNIIDEKKNARGELDGKEGEENRSEGIPDVDVARQQVFGQVLLEDIPYPQSYIEKIDDLGFHSHFPLLSDQDLVSRKGDRNRFQGLGRRPGKHCAGTGKTPGMTGAEELPLFRLPLDDTPKVGANRREGEKTPGGILQQYRRMPAELEKVSAADRHQIPVHGHLLLLTSSRTGREVAPQGPEGGGGQHRPDAGEQNGQKKPPPGRRYRALFHRTSCQCRQAKPERQVANMIKTK